MFYENYWLTDVRLESGFEYENDLVIHTNSELYNIRISQGKIAEIKPSSEALEDSIPKVSAHHLLALPAIREMHCHPDKTFLTGKWMARREAHIPDLIKREADLLAGVDSKTMEAKAAHMTNLIKNAGSLFIRAHADVHAKVGLKNLTAVQNVLKNDKDLIGYEIVAFPQGGLLKDGAISLMKEALASGAGIVGGIDPHYMEGNPDKALTAMMQLAVDHDAGIDLHLHETGKEGLYSIEKLADLTLDAGWQGKVSISHAFVLGSAEAEEVSRLAEKLKKANIDIITCGLVSDPIPNIALLEEAGVTVRLGSDNIYDSWNPFGNGDLIERLGRVIQVFCHYDEYYLSRSLRWITGGITPLDDKGRRVWPAVGEDATMILVDASCSAEAIARRAERKKFIVRGNVRS